MHKLTAGLLLTVVLFAPLVSYSDSSTLANVTAIPLNPMINEKSTYVITFALATAGVDVKSEEIKFPAGFDLSNAKMVKVETVYSGFPVGVLKIFGQTLIWDHDLAKRPACCLVVKMTIADIVNGNTLDNQITVVTKDVNGSVIDGPTPARFKLRLSSDTELGQQQIQKIEVTMKVKMKLTLLSFRNSGDVAVHAIKLKSEEGRIMFVNAKGWNKERLDQNKVLIKTEDKPILKAGRLIVLLKLENKESDIEWIAMDKEQNILTNGFINRLGMTVEKPEFSDYMKPKHSDYTFNGTSTCFPESQSNYTDSRAPICGTDVREGLYLSGNYRVTWEVTPYPDSYYQSFCKCSYSFVAILQDNPNKYGEITAYINWSVASNIDGLKGVKIWENIREGDYNLAIQAPHVDTWKIRIEKV